MRYSVIAITVFLLGMIIFIAIHGNSILLAIGDYLVIQDELHPTDVIHSIAGLDHRTDYVIQLYQQGYGKKIFFTAGWCDQIQAYHAQHAKERAIEKGVLPQAIAIDGSEVTSTYSEAVRLREFILQSPTPIHSVIIVSDPHHMRRAHWTYQHVLGDQVEVQMAPIPFPLTPYHRSWWTDDETRKFVKDEYLKIAYYYARYKFSWGPLTKWLASLDRE